MMKTLKQISATISLSLAALALAALATGCAADNELTDAGNANENGQLMTITVGTDKNASTRVAYEEDKDGNPKQLTWQEQDKLAVVGLDDNKVYKGKEEYTLASADIGKPTGSFTGKEIADATAYNIYYPSTIAISETDGTATPVIGTQTQEGDGSTSHLRHNIFLSATGVTNLNNIRLTMQSSILKFVLSNVPAEVGTLKRLEWTVETADGTKSILLNFSTEGEKVVFSTEKQTLTAYMAFLPDEMKVQAGGKFSVTLIGDRAYKAEITLPDGKTYEAGKRYTARIDGTSGTMTWEKVLAVMRFTVDTSKATSSSSSVGGLSSVGGSSSADGSKSFTIPFHQGETPAEITVDWGDGMEPTTVAKGIYIDNPSETFKHIYTDNARSIYTISIYSSQIDETQQQIPKFSFNADVLKGESEKLISIETPLLNTKENSFNGCFTGCTNLNEIPAGLFSKNMQVTDFKKCFGGCTSLKTIPGELFNENTKVTDFKECFTGCTSLTEIPAGLFDKNTKVVNFKECFFGCTKLTLIAPKLFYFNVEVSSFNQCFYNCTSLTEIPDELFKENAKVGSFSQCFYGCKSLKTIPGGVFSGSAEATDFSGCFTRCSGLTEISAGLFDKNTKVTSFNGCFSECKSLTAIPNGLFANNTATTSFNKCFYNCTNLTLNKHTFIDEVHTEETRFANLPSKVDFTSCFQEAGSDRSNNFGTAPDLWNYTYGTGNVSKSCFKDINHRVSNLDIIPDVWK